MKHVSLLLSGFVAAALSWSALAQDPVKVAPETYKVRLENDKVRVLEIDVKPGAKIPTHSHPAHLVVALSPCKVKFTLPDGKTNVAEMKTDDVIWSDPTTHSADNVGASDCHVLNIELKEPGKKAK